MRKFFSIWFLLLSLFSIQLLLAEENKIKIGTFNQEVSKFYSTKDGLPNDKINAVAIAEKGNVYAGTEKGLAVFANNGWRSIKKFAGKSIVFLSSNGNNIAALSNNEQLIIHILNSNDILNELILPEEFRTMLSSGCLFLDDKILLGTTDGIFSMEFNQNKKSQRVKPKLVGLENHEIRQVTVGKTGTIWAATNLALYKKEKNKKHWIPIYPQDGVRSWALVDARGVAMDSKNRIWFATPQGVGSFENKWKLFTGHDGLPYNDFTAITAGENGDIWFGTHKGAIRYDGKNWEYRQGKRWLPDDDVRDIAVDINGNAWFATKKGVGVIKRNPMTLAEKAKWYEDEIDRYNRRTPFGFVLEARLNKPGDKSKWSNHDSDNDGLWTSMYGAGECFAYAVTKDAKAKAKAEKVFEAMKFLGDVTQGAKHSPPAGFVARTILPTSGRNPNEGRIEGDIRNQKYRDKLWKVYEPRWPKSKDGKWYWKTDTSSDELDGHYFFYALYYDLVADTEEEKKRVSEHVKALTDHLIDHDFNLVDHDGKPTRWSRFNPYELNHDKNWFIERGLNSLSMLSYLAVAGHVTGDPKYREVMDELIEKHSYLQNMMKQKFNRGIGTGNHSDDEMAFMAYYHLIKYETDAERRSRYAASFNLSYHLEQPEMNPFFNFTYTAVCSDIVFTNTYGTHQLAPRGDWLVDAVDQLKRFPLDRRNWRHENNHRIDIKRLHEANRNFDESSFDGKGYRVNGKVIPVDECYFNHFNYDPWRLDTGGNGQGLGCGTVFLLPYYMGLYHGFILE
jgi:sugar lactone lactonase YvrE